MVGPVPVGGGAPITVQSMTNTPTADAAATLDQIRQLEQAGADIVRVSCPDEESTAAEVGVLVIDWTVMGAPPPTGTGPTMIWRLLRRSM